MSSQSEKTETLRERLKAGGYVVSTHRDGEVLKGAGGVDAHVGDVAVFTSPSFEVRNEGGRWQLAIATQGTDRSTHKDIDSVIRAIEEAIPAD